MQRTNYAQLVTYDAREGGDEDGGPGGETREVPCQGIGGCKPETGTVSIRIEPAVGSNNITEHNAFDGWRVVAKIMLVDKKKEARYDRLGLTRETPVVYWFIGPDRTKQRIESQFFNTVNDAAVGPAKELRFWKHSNKKGGKATFSRKHSNLDQYLFRPSGSVRRGPDTAAIRESPAFAFAWFECDPGCCGEVR